MNSKICLTSAIIAITLLAPASAHAQMGGGMRGDGMCQGMGANAGLMHDPDVTLKVVETQDGVSFQWTSTKADKVRALQDMGKAMESRHKEMMQRTPSARTK